MRTFQFIPIDETNEYLVQPGSLVMHTYSMHHDWHDIDHEHFSGNLCRVADYELTTGEHKRLVNGRSIEFLLKQRHHAIAIHREYLWLLQEVTP